MGVLRYLGIVLFSAALTYYGYEMYSSQTLQADAQKRLVNLWNVMSVHVPALADHSALFATNAHFVVKFMMYTLLISPCLILCGYTAIFHVVAWGLYVALFANPYVEFKDANGQAVAAVATAYALKHLSVLGGLLWYLCESCCCGDKK